MNRLMVATDFSPRSDRALRRAVLLAKQFAAGIDVVHAVDDDQPERIVAAEREAAAALLEDIAAGLRQADGIDCTTRVVLGDPFQGIVAAAEDIGPSMLVLGPHRRRALKDIFVGTTADRAIRQSRWPVLMAHGMPAAPYRRILLAVDFSDYCADAIRAIRTLGLDSGATTVAVHVFDAAGQGLLFQALAGEDQAEAARASAERAAIRAMTQFFDALGFTPPIRLQYPSSGDAAPVICTAATETGADLIVIGSHGRGGIGRVALGSVAEEMLRIAERDILIVPPSKSE